MKAPYFSNEAKRLESLASLKILDTLPELDFDNIAFLAAQICNMPIALISIVDDKRQWFKAKVGIDASETHRDFAFCAHAILQSDVFIVDDPLHDEKFKDNPLVTVGPHIKFYAGAPLFSPDGFPIGTVCVIDSKPNTLTAHQTQALKALSRQVTRLFELRMQIEHLDEVREHLLFRKTATENISEGIVLQNQSGAIVDFNPAALKILNLSAEELTGKTSMDPTWKAVNEKGHDLPGHEHPAMLCLSTGQKQNNFIMGIKQNHEHMKWLKVNSAPLFEENLTSPIYVVTTFVDITVDLEMQKNIRQNQKELRFVLDNVPYMIGHWDSQLINLEANTAYKKYIGVTPQEMKGKHFKDILGESVFQKVRPQVAKVLEGHTVEFESTNLRLDGHLNYSTICYIPDIQDGKVVGFLSIVVDITRLKELEMSRQRLEINLIESARLSALGEMAGGVAHEINNPLTIILGNIMLLKKKFEVGTLIRDEDIKGFETIERTVARIAKIVKGLRAYSRDAENDPFESTTIESIIEHTTELCAEKFKLNDIILKSNCDTSIKIECRPSQLSQVIMNLLINSFDAIIELPQKWIEIQVIENTSSVEIHVIDSGVGIDNHVVEKMMQPFFTTKNVGKGTGLGLSISFGIAKSHHGDLTYKNGCSNTTFVLKLPKTQSIKTGPLHCS